MVLLLFFAYFYRMRYVAAYLLAALAGNEAPQAKDIQKILESVGIEADDTRMQKVWPYPIVLQPNILSIMGIAYVCRLITMVLWPIVRPFF